MIAVERAELVVVVVLDARRWQEAVERLEVLVCGRRTAMKEQQLYRRIVAHTLRPHVERAFRRRDRDHPHTARPRVFPSGVVEICGHCRCRRRCWRKRPSLRWRSTKVHATET